MDELIKEKRLIVEPNLRDYGLARSLCWDDVRSEICYTANVNPAELAVIRKSKEFGNKPALIWVSSAGERIEYSFEELAQESARFAYLLSGAGIKRGSRVLLFSNRVPALYFAMLGIAWLGGVIVPVFSTFGKDALSYRIENSGASAIVCHEELMAKLPANPKVAVIRIARDHAIQEAPKGAEVAVERLQIEDPLLILYTSGSTGRPKGIWHSQDIMTFFYVSGRYHFDLHPQDVFWHTGDPAWVAGFAGVWTAWVSGVPVLSYEGRFDVERWYSIMEENRVSVISTVPTALRLLKKAGLAAAKKRDISSIRFVHAGGEYVDPSIVKWGTEVFGIPVHDAYGQTETSTYVIANYISMPIKPGSMGKPLPGVEALIVDENGQPIPTNTPGILAFKPGFPALAEGIWGDEERWKQQFKNDLYMTGDMAYMDGDGYFWYLGRADDIIKVSGYRVSPVEIEATIMQHAAIAEAAVVALSDVERGAKIKAFVVLRQGNSPSEALKHEIEAQVRTRLASHVVPREIEFVAELPHTISGKIMRRILRAKESGQALGDLSSLENPDMVKG